MDGLGKALGDAMELFAKVALVFTGAMVTSVLALVLTIWWPVGWWTVALVFGGGLAGYTAFKKYLGD